MNIEAEGGELVLRNNDGTIAIIKSSDRSRALSALSIGNDSVIDDMISSYPNAKDYAKSGMKVPKKAIEINSQPSDENTLIKELLSKRKKRSPKEIGGPGAYYSSDLFNI